MMPTYRLCRLFFLASLAHSVYSVNVFPIPTKITPKQSVLVLSVGGFRPDYLKETSCPTLKEFINRGVAAEYVQTSINIASLVNHYSIATGLFPESHGIISDTMVDQKLKRVFKSETRQDPGWWKNVHPVWKGNEDQGKGKSGVCRWPGVYETLLPKLNCQHKRASSFKKDIDRVIDWFVNENVNLGLLYANDIKKAALKWGPRSKQVHQEVKVFDFLLNYLLLKIREHELDVNILITSDHGVTDLNWNHVIDLDKCIDHRSYILLHAQGTLLFYPSHGHTIQAVYEHLKTCSNLKVYTKDTLPSRYHYSHHHRIPPIIAFAHLGAVVRSSKSIHRKVDKVLNGMDWSSRNLGATGYDPVYMDMKSVFFAAGPSFRKGLKQPAINNTDIYPLICHLLNIQPRPNNGSFHVIKPMLTGSALSIIDTNTPRPSSGDSRRPSRIGGHKSNGFASDRGLNVLFWCLVIATAVMLAFCCVGCVHTSWKKFQGPSGNTGVYPPGAKGLLSMHSSDEE